MTEALRLFDLHCHLDFAENATELADGLVARGIDALSATISPEGYERAATLLAPFANVQVALGLHPWWVADGRCGEDAVAHFERLAAQAQFIGEVGLDFAPAHAASREAQLAAFGRAIYACVNADGQPRKVLTIHAVRSASAVLDVLEDAGATQTCACIFHWFSGTSDELQRALELGCLFSINPRMLATKRGRAYVRALPSDHLLLETDLPPQSVGRFDATDIESALQTALSQLAQLRDENPDDLTHRIGCTSRNILGL